MNTKITFFILVRCMYVFVDVDVCRLRSVHSLTHSIHWWRQLPLHFKTIKKTPNFRVVGARSVQNVIQSFPWIAKIKISIFPHTVGTIVCPYGKFWFSLLFVSKFWFSQPRAKFATFFPRRILLLMKAQAIMAECEKLSLEVS